MSIRSTFLQALLRPRALPRGERAPASVRRGGALRRRVRQAVLVLAASLAGVAPAWSSATDEAVVQAAFILNFAKFTEWPAAAGPARTGVLQLCLQGGRGELVEALKALEGKQVHGQAVQVRKLARGEDLRACHVLVVGEGGMPPGAPQPGTLVIGDQPGFAQAGGHIGLVRTGSKLKFDINRSTAQQAGLKLSSQLLSLAATVIDASVGKD
jgi:hypothetical protein